MELICHPGRLCGEVRVPGSKSHTIRAIAIAALAPGTSEIRVPLDSADARSARATYAALGAQFTDEPRLWRVQGTDGQLLVPANVIDVGNSGTTLRLALGSAAMLDAGMAILTGDKQIRRRTRGATGPGPQRAGRQCLLRTGQWLRPLRGGWPPAWRRGLHRGGQQPVPVQPADQRAPGGQCHRHPRDLAQRSALRDDDSRLVAPAGHPGGRER